VADAIKIIELMNHSDWKGLWEVSNPKSNSKQGQQWIQTRCLRALYGWIWKPPKREKLQHFVQPFSVITFIFFFLIYRQNLSHV